MKYALISLLFLTGSLRAQPKEFSVTITRAANTTAYTAGDAVSNEADSLLQQIVFGSEIRRGVIRSVRLSEDDGDVTNANFRVFLLSDSTGFGLVPDNDAFVMSSTKLANVVGYSDMVLAVTGSAGATSSFDQNDGVNIYFDSGGSLNTNGLYVLVTATAAYTPSSAEVFTVTIVVEPWTSN